MLDHRSRDHVPDVLCVVSLQTLKSDLETRLVSCGSRAALQTLLCHVAVQVAVAGQCPEARLPADRSHAVVGRLCQTSARIPDLTLLFSAALADRPDAAVSLTYYKGVITRSASRPWKPDPI